MPNGLLFSPSFASNFIFHHSIYFPSKGLSPFGAKCNNIPCSVISGISGQPTLVGPGPRKRIKGNTLKEKFYMIQMIYQAVKCLSTMQETQVRSLVWEDPLEKEMAIHSSTIAWKIPWTEEHGKLQSMGLQSRTRLSNFTSASPQSSQIRTTEVLNFLGTQGYRISQKKKKAQISKDHVKYLRYLVNPGSRQLSPDRKQTIVDLSTLKTKKHILRHSKILKNLDSRIQTND